MSTCSAYLEKKIINTPEAKILNLCANRDKKYGDVILLYFLNQSVNAVHLSRKVLTEKKKSGVVNFQNYLLRSKVV